MDSKAAVKKPFKKAVAEQLKAPKPAGPSKTAIEEMVAQVRKKPKEWKKNVSVPMDTAMREKWFALADATTLTHADVLRLALEFAYNTPEFHELLKRL